MPSSRRYELTPEQELALLLKAGIKRATTQIGDEAHTKEGGEEIFPDLKDRVQKILHILKTEPMKATDVFSLIMYDIEDDKVRNAVAKYLIQKGCIRIQKSVYILKAHHRIYKEILQALKDVQACYDNHDSIIFVPVPPSVPGSMQIIGKEVNIDRLLNDPNVLFF